MSSTNRGAVRSPNDFYQTDPAEIFRFIEYWREADPAAEDFWSKPRRILDPCAGGLTEQVIVPQKGEKPPLVFNPSDMSYPLAIHLSSHQLGRDHVQHVVDTIDIRENSRAATKGDFLTRPFNLNDTYDMVISNPPFSMALAFIQQALRVVKPGGYVVMLLRLNFFGSKDRNDFFLSGNMPNASYVHAQRLGFTPDGGTDSIEYQHAIWKNTGEVCNETKLRILPY